MLTPIDIAEDMNHINIARFLKGKITVEELRKAEEMKMENAGEDLEDGQSEDEEGTDAEGEGEGLE